MDPERLARDTVASVLEWQPRPEDGVVVESAEVVQVAGDGPGVVVLWSQVTREQGARRFGVLLSVAAFAGVDVDALVRTLLHMLRGPHATPADAQTRTWYAQLG